MEKWTRMFSFEARLTEISLYMPQLPQFLENLRILHFSDMHTRRYGHNEKRLHQLLRQGCDLLTCSGDWCYPAKVYLWDRDRDPSRNHEIRRKRKAALMTQALHVCRQLQDDFTCPLGFYSVQGNHDSTKFMKQIAELGATVLNNESQEIELPGRGRFNLCGVRCNGRPSADITATLLKLNGDLFTVGLCHYPEMAEALIAGGVDLVLAGHTHGGQLCLPTGRPILTHSRTGTKYLAGLQRLGNSFIYTTRGVGSTWIRFRICCPAEITRLTLHRGDHDQTTVRQGIRLNG